MFDGPSHGQPSPMVAAQQSQKAALPKRFWREAGIAQTADGFVLILDGRAARTPGKRPLTAPTRAAAEALAAEWSAVADLIDPAHMPLTRLINSAIDGVADRAGEVRADIVKYAGSDLLCYRAAEPERLVARQTELWDPLLRWAREELGGRLSLAEGVMFVEQPEDALAAIGRAVDATPAPHALAALHSITTLTGSAVIALAVARKRISADEAWIAAHVDEDVQMEAWGADEEALARRKLRRAEFDAAVRLLA